MRPLTRLRIPTIGVALTATLGAGLLMAPAAHAAPDTKNAYVKRIKPVQSVNTYVTIKDHHGRKYPIKVTTTWAYKSPKSALLRSIVIRENGFPRGQCIFPDLYFANANDWEAQRGRYGKICDGGHKAYSVMRTVRARSGSNLGQLWIRTPNPSHPGCCGARQYTIQYNIARR
ncbi:hypothetical protein [Nonomuraea sp. LPB2021202275-12-8]|uniref:hypothetical protein n=1 Tax=Nonomuraea sp. LPB2021202275-12-8 TaxID=3120159 RepID=UPI00300D3A0C